MNNKEFIASLAQATGRTQKETASLTDTLADIIAESIKEGAEVKLGSLGSIEPKAKEQRIIVNPKTKVEMLVPPKIVAEFKPSKTLKDKCRNI